MELTPVISDGLSADLKAEGITTVLRGRSPGELMEFQIGSAEPRAYQENTIGPRSSSIA